MTRRIFSGPRLIGGIVAVLLGVALILALRTPPVEADIGYADRGPLRVTIDDLGETRVRDLYTVSAPIGGHLLRIPLKPGDRVVAGETVVARILPADPEPLDARRSAQTAAQVRASEAELAAAETRLREAGRQESVAARDLYRAEQLAARGFVAQAALDQARLARTGAAAAVGEAQAAAEAARHALAALRATLTVTGGRGRGGVAVTTPVSGYVLGVPQESERVVVAGAPLVEIGDPTRLEIATDYLSADAVKIRPGAPVLIESWGGEEPLRGRVRRVEPVGFTKISALGVEEQRVNVLIDFAAPRQAWARLGHGYRATTRVLVAAADDVVRIPVSALFRNAGEWSVFIVDASGRARLKVVGIGLMNADWAEVRTGTAPGDRLILHPGDRIADGVKVRARGV